MPWLKLTQQSKGGGSLSKTPSPMPCCLLAPHYAEHVVDLRFFTRISDIWGSSKLTKCFSFTVPWLMTSSIAQTGNLRKRLLDRKSANRDIIRLTNRLVSCDLGRRGGWLVKEQANEQNQPLDAATILFAEKGFDAARADDIAKAAR